MGRGGPLYNSRFKLVLPCPLLLSFPLCFICSKICCTQHFQKLYQKRVYFEQIVITYSQNPIHVVIHLKTCSILTSSAAMVRGDLITRGSGLCIFISSELYSSEGVGSGCWPLSYTNYTQAISNCSTFYINSYIV